MFQDSVPPFSDFSDSAETRQSENSDWILYLEAAGMTSNFIRSSKEGNVVPAAARWEKKKERSPLPRQMSNSVPAAARGRGQNPACQIRPESRRRAAERRSQASPRARGRTQAANELIEKDRCGVLVIRLHVGADHSERRQRSQI